MTRKTKITLGILAGAAVCIGIGIAMADDELMESVSEKVAGLSGTITDRIKSLVGDEEKLLAIVREKVSEFAGRAAEQYTEVSEG